MRSDKKEFILVVANFAAHSDEGTIRIPKEAFDYMAINPQKVKSAKELLSKKNIVLSSRWDKDFYFNIDAYSVKIIKFSMH